MNENEIKPVYPKVGHMQLDADGGYYCRHVTAMTDEGLHKKSDIAGQLGMRDREIDRLTAERDDAMAAADSKAGWEWKKRAEKAEAERDAAVAERDNMRSAIAALMVMSPYGK